MNALNASNAPTADDKKGGFHEEGVKWGTDAQGNVVVSPSVPGPYAPSGWRKGVRNPFLLQKEAVGFRHG